MFDRDTVPRTLRLLCLCALTSLAALQTSCNTRPPVQSASASPGAIPAGYGGGYPDSSELPAAASQPRPILASFGLPALGGHARPSGPVPAVTARAAIVVQANTGEILFERNADTRMSVASTQKLLLGLMMVEAGNLGKMITVEKSDTWAEPTKMGIQTGQIYRKADLLKAVLVRSCNDIARCLARDHSGSVAAFAQAMDRRARELGMNNSHFTNASGLPEPPGQYSTARDLSILAAAAMRHPFLREAVSTQAMNFRFSNGRTVPIQNTNRVLRTFPYCTGMKTGYTNAAGRCLVSSAEYNGRKVIAVVLGSKSPNVWTESQALLQWGLGM